MTDIEILEIMKEALHEIEIETFYTEYGHELYDVELHVDGAIKYLNNKISSIKIAEKNKLYNEE